MMRFCYKRWVKICAMILCIVSFNLMAGSVLFIIAGHSKGIYSKSEQEVWEEAKSSICNKYSIRAAAGFEEDFGQDSLKDTNFCYGVLQTDKIDELDLNDKRLYEVYHFDQDVSKDMLYIHSYSLGDNTNIRAGNSLFDSFYIYNSEGEYNTYKEAVELCFYTRDTRKFYCKAGNMIYPVTPYVQIPGYSDSGEPAEWQGGYSWGEGQEQIYADPIASKELPDGQMEYFWVNGSDQIYMNGQTWYLADVVIVQQRDISEYGTVVSDDMDDSNYLDFMLENGYITTYTGNIKDTVPYYVLSYVNEPLDTDGDYFHQSLLGKIGNWQKQDFFVQSRALIQFFFSMRYTAFAVLLVCGILFFGSFGVWMTGAGHKASSEVTAGWLEKMPLDVFAALAAGLFWGMLLTEAYCIKVIRDIKISIWAGMFLALFAEILALVCCMDVAIRLKLGKWWKNTLCWRICTKLCGFLRRSAAKLQQAFPMIWKAWGLMALLAVLEFLGLSATAYAPGARVRLWFLEKLVLYAFLTVCLLQMKKLQQAGEKLSNGEMDSRIDTSRMFWDLKAHGDNLNHIREGIHSAVADQLKSERFQTELITNVSHDIKTPLTSIINYVDLLEKEEIDNPAIQEYIDVLSRQSTRLKKLIEDLMEASKASTGNLSIAWEDCDAQVMLTQTIGEFEEKLKSNQVELIVKGNEEPVIISADPRHLWRIFDNLMNNICKYAQPATRAYVNMEKKEQQGRIIFRNISKYALNIDSEELMKRFVRGDSSRNTEGNGLGLSIAKSLTELMHGEFELVVDGDLFKVVITFPVIEG